LLDQISTAFDQHGYRPHEFGDSMLIERGCRIASLPTADQPTISIPGGNQSKGAATDCSETQETTP
jgi:hypothetical protein